jgi:hypothetical protein
VTVRIVINVTNGVVQSPPRANANRIEQDVTWIINNPQGSGITFANPPIEFIKPAPAGYNDWPGTAVTQDPQNPNQWNASVNKRLPPGSNPELYKYDIVWTTGRLDPEIGNNPVPPDDRDEDEDKDKDKP